MTECAFKWQSTGILFFFRLLLTSLLLIAQTVAFYFPHCTCQDHLSFRPYSENATFLVSFFAWSAVLDIAFYCKCPILSVFVSIQSAVASAGSMKRITCCAVEDFSCKRPAWHWVFTTTNIKKPFHETHSLKPYFAAQSVMESTKHAFIWICQVVKKDSPLTWDILSTSSMFFFFLLKAHFSGQSCLLFFFYSQKCVFFFFFVLTWETNARLQACNTTPSSGSQSGRLPPLTLDFHNIPGVFMLFKLHILSALDQ